MATSRDGYELFRRAVQERDAEAWAAIVARYRRLLIAWASHSHVTRAAAEPFEDVADQAFARAWAALSPQRFTDFPNLPALLAYLRACVTATAIDIARAQTTQERVSQHVERHDPLSPEQLVLDSLERAELWRIIASTATTEAERVVLVERFVRNLPPRFILARHPTHFADVIAIYRAIRNLCERLRRHPDLRQYYAERYAA
jgi:DNA-directed RNA polymerase specialized sigma24 family protein